ncbi:unnamed protein product [Rotaria sp. Silwood2]|nr:unnamed protein product [Rotaria sp. Silwood2]CAF2699408.1 unnamed protein product [Rotaria sp. Silwood2]CAF4074188.1 unnamed protein product [Rotaria sp. Silwood2]CAF4578929.1 unnamed protein product [Rotaria sp. Silwood2]
MNRLCLLSASMKIVSFISKISETLGFAPAEYIQRNSRHILKKLKPTEVNINLKIEDTTIEDIPVRIYSPLNLYDDKTEDLPAIIL